MNKIKRKEKDNKFKCEMCGGTFPREWSDKEAIKEREELWDNPGGKWSIVCDDCFQKVHPKKHKKLARQHGYKK